jgi:hypothetical protein
MREYQVRICERLGVKFPGPTRQSRRFDRLLATSGLPRRTDVVRPHAQVRFVPPTCDINSFNHFIGAQGEVRRDLNADFLCGFQIYDEFELARLFDWDVARACSAQYFDELATQ